MKRRLIVNADDFNLTPGVCEAILDCHVRGIVSSTTVLINLPFCSGPLQKARELPSLGIGLHLNVTLGKPVSAAMEVPGLLNDQGEFNRANKESPPDMKEVIFEYHNQIKAFKSTFGRLPTHVDTHHQVHDHADYLRAVEVICENYHLPMRRSKLSAGNSARQADYFLGDLKPERHWTEDSLMPVLNDIESGTSELMCHPGRHDSDLEAVSSFTAGRQIEWKLFSQAKLREMLAAQGVELTHFGLCYT